MYKEKLLPMTFFSKTNRLNQRRYMFYKGVKRYYKLTRMIDWHDLISYKLQRRQPLIQDHSGWANIE